MHISVNNLINEYFARALCVLPYKIVKLFFKLSILSWMYLIFGEQEEEAVQKFSME